MNFQLSTKLASRRTTTLLGLILGVTAITIAFAPHAHAATMQPIQDVLGGDSGLKVRQIWQSMLNFANSVMVIALLVIAFSNILHIQLDNYGIKKILPSLIMAIVLANFSYFICRMLVDIANMLLKAIMDAHFVAAGTSTSGLDKMKSSVSLSEFTTTLPVPGENFWSNAGAFFLGQLGKIIGAVFILILSFLFFIRNWVLYFLIALSPVGFIAMAIPQGKSVFQAWWKNFIQWNFMVVVSAFWLWVGAVFLASDIVGTGGGGQTMMFVFAIACYYFAITTPFKMGGAIMSGWGNLGKRAWASTGGAGLNLAKNEIITKRVDDYKNQLHNAYLNQGRSDKPYNLVGAFVRRGRRISDIRAENKRAIEGTQNTLGREAWGGKYGQHSTFVDMLHKNNPEYKSRALRFGDKMARIDSDFGEVEWMQEKLRNDAYEANYQHRAATEAWRQRTEAEKKRKERIDNQVRTDAFQPVRTPENRYYSEDDAGSEGARRDEINDWYLAELTEVEHTGLISKKTQNDFEKNATGLTLGIAQIIDQFKDLDEELVKATEEREQARNYQGPDKADKEKKTQEWLDMVIEERQHIQTGLAAQIGQINEKTGGRYTEGIKKMLFESEAATLDANGKVTSVDLARAKTIEDIYGIPPEAKKMSQSRVDKGLSNWYKEEITAEANKRNGLESLRKTIRDFEKETAVEIGGRKQSIASLYLAGYGPEYVNSKSEQEIYAYMSNAFKELSNSRSPIYESSIEEFCELISRTSVRNPQTAKILQNILGDAMTTGINHSRLNTPVVKGSEQAAREKVIADFRITDSAGKAIASADTKGYESALATLTAPQRQQIEQQYETIKHGEMVKRHFAEFKLEADKFKDRNGDYYANVSKDKYGRYQVGIADYDANKHGSIEEYTDKVSTIIQSVSTQGYNDPTNMGLASAFGRRNPARGEGGKQRRDTTPKRGRGRPIFGELE